MKISRFCLMDNRGKLIDEHFLDILQARIKTYESLIITNGPNAIVKWWFKELLADAWSLKRLEMVSFEGPVITGWECSTNWWRKGIVEKYEPKFLYHTNYKGHNCKKAIPYFSSSTDSLFLIYLSIKVKIIPYGLVGKNFSTSMRRYALHCSQDRYVSYNSIWMKIN